MTASRADFCFHPMRCPAVSSKLPSAVLSLRDLLWSKLSLDEPGVLVPWSFHWSRFRGIARSPPVRLTPPTSPSFAASHSAIQVPTLVKRPTLTRSPITAAQSGLRTKTALHRLGQRTLTLNRRSNTLLSTTIRYVHDRGMPPLLQSRH